MSAYVHDTQFFTRRTAVLAVIIAAHIALIWALATGLAERVVHIAAPPIKTTIVQQHRKHLKPPPPPPPQLQHQRVEVPPPAIQINVPAAEQQHAITVTHHVKKAPPRPVHYTYTPLGRGRDFPSTQEFYPQASQRLGEEGTAVVKICVGPNGRLSSEPKIVRSSHSPRLDRAAIRYAKATSGHWTPEKRDGKPINFCGELPIKFQLNDF